MSNETEREPDKVNLQYELRSLIDGSLLARGDYNFCAKRSVKYESFIISDYPIPLDEPEVHSYVHDIKFGNFANQLRTSLLAVTAESGFQQTHSFTFSFLKGFFCYMALCAVCAAIIYELITKW